MSVDWSFDDRSDEALRAIRDGMVRGLENVADDILHRARYKVPVRTANLQDSLQKKPTKVTQHKATIRFGALAPYAANVEYGTGLFNERPGAPKERIRPTNSKALAWTAPGYDRPAPGDSSAWRKLRNTKTGRTYIDSEGNRREGRAATVVSSIKGQKPQPYLRPAIREVVGTKRASRLMARGLREALAKRLRRSRRS